ncbi:MAG: hypothetical protein DSZ28_05830 [Thiothrix sp.]|nr:MAG: hypothetical protein DSZ28_05830 [Thiothrix sp.]
MNTVEDILVKHDTAIAEIIEQNNALTDQNITLHKTVHHLEKAITKQAVYDANKSTFSPTLTSSIVTELIYGGLILAAGITYLAFIDVFSLSSYFEFLK